MPRLPSSTSVSPGLAPLVSLIAAACALLAVGGCGGRSIAALNAAPRAAPLVTIFEAQAELLASPGPTLALLKGLGVDDVKVFVPWDSLAPDSLSRTRPRFDASSPAAYPAATWAQYDALVRAAKARGLGVDLALEGPAPLWATAPTVPHGTLPGFLGAWEPSASAFGAFVTAVATRYSGRYKPPGETTPLPRVHFWEIWNEPNYGQDLAPQAIDDSRVEVSPAYYRALLDAAWTALHLTGHGLDTILFGEVAPRGLTVGNNPGNFSGMVPLRFIRALYCVGQNLRPLRGTQAELRSCPATTAASRSFVAENPALFHASGFAFHPYPQGAAPNVRTSDEPDYADLPQLPELERTLNGGLSAYGSRTRFPLYDTEFGYHTDPPETGAPGINPALAAYYLNWAEYISWLDPRVMSWDQYLLADPAPGPSSFDTGIEFADGRQKATYDAFRMPVYLPATIAKAGQAVEVWGCVRPAHYIPMRLRARQFASIQLAPAADGPFSTIRRVAITDAYGYFDTRVMFPTTGFVRISWRYPHGSEIHSRTVRIRIS